MLLMALSSQVLNISRVGDSTDLFWHREVRVRQFFVPWQWDEGRRSYFAVVALSGSVNFPTVPESLITGETLVLFLLYEQSF